MYKFINYFINLIQKVYNNKFIRFSFTGGLGTITNLIIFYLFCDKLKQPANFGAILAFIAAVTQNYFINHFWSFKNYSKENKISFISYIKFISVSLIGLAVNLIVLNLILIFFKLPLKVIAQGIGILAGLIINYFGARRLVFNKTIKY